MPKAVQLSAATSFPRNEMVSRLAERLVRQAAGTPADDGDVLLDVEIDGVRCVLVRSHDQQKPAPPPLRRPRITQDLLSPREQEIARMIGEGHSNKTVAAVLDISSWTVNTHLRRIFAKLGVTSRAAMVAKLMRGA